MWIRVWRWQAAHLGEISIIDLVDVDTVQGHLSGGGDGESLVHTAQGHAVDLVGSGNKEEARCQLLEEHHALSPETTSQEDDHGTRGDGLLELRRLGHVAACEGQGDVLRGIEAGGNLLQPVC